MISVRAFLLVQNLEPPDGERPWILEPLMEVFAPRLPLELTSGNLVCILDADGKDVGTQRHIRFNLDGPSGEMIKTIQEGPVVFPRNLDAISTVTAEYPAKGLVLKEPGIHWFRVLLDGQRIARTPLRVQEAYPSEHDPRRTA